MLMCTANPELNKIMACSLIHSPISIYDKYVDDVMHFQNIGQCTGN